MKALKISALLFLTALLIFTASCKTKQPADTEQKFAISDTFFKYLEFDTASVKQVEGELSLTGKVTFDENQVARIFAFTGGIIQTLKVQLGDYVQKGQVLAVIRSIEGADYSNQLVSAESNLETAKKNVDAVQNYFANGLASEKELASAQNDLKKAQSELDRINSILGTLGEDANQFIYIKSPTSGYIVEKNATENMVFRNDNPNSLFTIANLDKVFVIANVFESDIAKIKTGYEAEIITLSYPDKTFNGKIDKVYNVIDPDTKVLKVRIVLSNPELFLKPEMFANVVVRYNEDKKMVRIPSEAITFDKNKNFVMVFHSKSNVETREVHIYKVTGESTYILDGLKPGEVIISKNNLIIYNALNG
jgi:cobalt-zinc-cadmium efflux system membrane fusion protein